MSQLVNYKKYPVTPPKVVAIAREKGLKPTHPFPDPTLPAPPPRYGQDLTYGVGTIPPMPCYPGSNEADLKRKMAKLLGVFAADDKKGMAKRLFDKFLAKQRKITYFDDPDLNAAAAAHENIRDFCDRALGAPALSALTPKRTLAQPQSGKTRIHQALKAAGWDIRKLVAPTDLEPPAFNKGHKSPFTSRNTEDHSNGLFVMVDAIQYAYAIATHYYYDSANHAYGLNLKFVFYDVFGLDDEDLKTYGSYSDSIFSFDASIGISAWWFLQHEYGYAPLVTRITVEQYYEVVVAI